MQDKQILLSHVNEMHTTAMGVNRIKRNLNIDVPDVVAYCKSKVLEKNCHIYLQGKNWYCEIDDIRITVNAHSYTVITAHKVKR